VVKGLSHPPALVEMNTGNGIKPSTLLLDFTMAYAMIDRLILYVMKCDVKASGDRKYAGSGSPKRNLFCRIVVPSISDGVPYLSSSKIEYPDFDNQILSSKSYSVLIIFPIFRKDHNYAKHFTIFYSEYLSEHVSLVWHGICKISDQKQSTERPTSEAGHDEKSRLAWMFKKNN
jgi:hypothetical protein